MSFSERKTGRPSVIEPSSVVLPAGMKAATMGLTTGHTVDLKDGTEIDIGTRHEETTKKKSSMLGDYRRLSAATLKSQEALSRRRQTLLAHRRSSIRSDLSMPSAVPVGSSQGGKRLSWLGTAGESEPRFKLQSDSGLGNMSEEGSESGSSVLWSESGSGEQSSKRALKFEGLATSTMPQGLKAKVTKYKKSISTIVDDVVDKSWRDEMYGLKSSTEAKLEKVHFLSIPKCAFKYHCAICNSRGNLFCKSCSHINDWLHKPKMFHPVCYCSKEHAMQDHFHLYVCQHLHEVRNKEILVSHGASGRLAEIDQTRFAQEYIVDYIRSTAMDMQARGLLQLAQQGASFAIQVTKFFLGTDHPVYIEAELLMACCSAIKGDRQIAQKCLNRIDAQVQMSGVPVAERHRADLYRARGMVSMLAGNFRQAQKQFSEEVITLSERYGTLFWRTTCAFHRLGGAFLADEKIEVAASLYKQVAVQWSDFLSNHINENRNPKMKRHTSMPKASLKAVLKISVILTLDPDCIIEGIIVLESLRQFWKQHPGLCVPADIMHTEFAISLLKLDMGQYRKAGVSIALAKQIMLHEEVGDKLKLNIIDAYKQIKGICLYRHIPPKVKKKSRFFLEQRKANMFGDGSKHMTYVKKHVENLTDIPKVVTTRAFLGPGTYSEKEYKLY